MKTMLSGIDLIIECRDFRVPITSRNPLLEENLAGRERVVVYTKKDLGLDLGQNRKVLNFLPLHWFRRVVVILNVIEWI